VIIEMKVEPSLEVICLFSTYSRCRKMVNSCVMAHLICYYITRAEVRDNRHPYIDTVERLDSSGYSRIHMITNNAITRRDQCADQGSFRGLDFELVSNSDADGWMIVTLSVELIPIYHMCFEI
jgi:hypothetical protein